jgi:uncharacterized protein (TIRG00374 family)
MGPRRPLAHCGTLGSTARVTQQRVWDRRRSIVLGLVGLATLGIIAVRVMPQIGSYSAAGTALGHMTPAAVGVLAVSVVTYLALYGLPFMAAVPRLRFWQGQQVNQAAFTIGNGLPAGGAVGLGVQYGMLAGYGVDQTAGTAAVAAIAVWSTLITLGVPVLGIGAMQLSGHGSRGYLVPSALALAALLTTVGGFALAMRRESVAAGLARLGNRILGPFARRFQKGRQLDLAPGFLRFRTDLVDLVRRRWALITAAQLGVIGAQFAVLYCSLRGVEGWPSAGTPMLVVFGAFAIAQLGLMVPLTPGGLGTVDAALITLLVSQGVPAGQATAADLVWRAASFVPQILLGGAALVAWSRLRPAHAVRRRVDRGEHGPDHQPGGLAVVEA